MVVAFIACAAAADSDKLTQLITKGQITADALKALAYADVPEKWRSREEDQSTEKSVRKVFFRGKDKILEVAWSKEWTGAKSNYFTASVYDGNRRVSSVFRISDEATAVMQAKDARDDYEMMTFIKDNGQGAILISTTNGYFQKIELSGRETHLMDDLEYTKTAVMLNGVAKPLVDEIKSRMNKTAPSTNTN